MKDGKKQKINDSDSRINDQIDQIIERSKVTNAALKKMLIGLEKNREVEIEKMKNK